MSASTTDNASSYAGLANKQVSAANGIDYAYRDTRPEGSAGVPLVLLQHFRGNLDSWDPALIDDLAGARRVIAFDNAGRGTRGVWRLNNAGLLTKVGRPDAAAASAVEHGIWPDGRHLYRVG
jgi:hypothetical protein